MNTYDINRFLVDDGRGGKNIKYNDFAAPMFGDKAIFLAACRASFSAGEVVEGYRESSEFTADEQKVIDNLQDKELKTAMLAVKSISEFFRSIVISFTSDKKFVITAHYTSLGARYMFAKTGKKYEVDTEYYKEGSFKISETPIDGTYDYDCGVMLDGESFSCVLSAQTGLVTIQNYIFAKIPTVIIDEKPNAVGGFDVDPATIAYNCEILKDVRYGSRVMHKAEPCDSNYENDKNESEAQRTMRQTLNLYLPENVKAHSQNCLIFCVHGGAWTGGDKEGYNDICKYYASLGYFAATVNHTYVGRRYEDGERVTLPCILEELDAAVAKIKQLSDENGWNITKAATTGYSSGSHLATWYAYAKGSRKDAHIPVVFTFSMVGPMSFHLDCWDGPRTPLGPQLASIFLNDNDLFCVPESGEKKQQFESVAAMQILRDELNEYDFTKCDKKIFDEKIGSISPLWFVENGYGVPTILAEAAQDNSLISRRHAEKMEKALTQAGIDHKVIVFPNSDHMGAGNAECGNVYRKYQKIFMKKYFGY